MPYEKGLRLKKKKCYFFLQPSVDYLRYLVDAEGLQTTTEVNTCLNAPRPKDVHQLQLFLGLVIYYG